MKNFDSLERDLEALAASQNGEVPDSQRELHSLRELLKSASMERQRSSQHQEWAWTRCCARMNESSSNPSIWYLFNRNLRWLGTGMAVALVALCMPYFSNSGGGTLPVVTSNSKTISAVPFHSPKAQADVIWVSGYNYLPASHTIR